MSEGTASPALVRNDVPKPARRSVLAPPRGKAAILEALAASLLFAAVLPGSGQASPAQERRGALTVDVKLNAPADARRVRLWIPYPMSDENQEISAVSIGGNYAAAGVYREGRFGNAILYAEWNAPATERRLTYTFRAVRKEVVTKDFPATEGGRAGREIAQYRVPARPGPVPEAVVERAARITAGKATVREKAAALYDWVVENMYRDPNVKGCGTGEVEALLGKLGGKCADIHSVFVALARAAGVPAREIFGIRMPNGPEGDITRSQHCWAEFYEPGYGWVVVDPADVRKAILEKKIPLSDATTLRAYYFGAVDASRIAFGSGRDIVLNPAQSGGPLNYFMYPYAEADGRPLNEDLFGFNIGYAIGFRES